MSTCYNPRNLKTNCGFCAIAYALSVQRGISVNADQLYIETLDRLGLSHDGDNDSLPRQLIFPEPGLDSRRVSTGYSALAGRAYGLSSYTITAVAEASGLRFRADMTDLTLPRHFLNVYAARTHVAGWNLNEFEQARLNILRAQGRNPHPDAVRRHIRDTLSGHSIIGSKTTNHFINVHIDGSGHITAFDAQDGITYDGRGLHARLHTIDLFMHLV